MAGRALAAANASHHLSSRTIIALVMSASFTRQSKPRSLQTWQHIVGTHNCNTVQQRHWRCSPGDLLATTARPQPSWYRAVAEGSEKKRKLKRKTQPNRDTGAESGKRYPFRHGPWLGYQMFLGSLTGLKTGTGNEIPTASQELTLVPTWIAVDSFAYRPQGFKRLS